MPISLIQMKSPTSTVSFLFRLLPDPPRPATGASTPASPSVLWPAIDSSTAGGSTPSVGACSPLLEPAHLCWDLLQNP